MLALLAALILCGPIDPPAWLVERPDVFAAVEQLARAEEVVTRWDGQAYFLDPVTRMYQPVMHRDWAVRTWRQRWQDLRGVPHTGEAERFAFLDQAAAERQVRFGRSWIEAARKRQSVAPGPLWVQEIEEQITEVEIRVAAWEELRSALRPDFSPVSRRYSLGALRDRLGMEAFYEGTMPAVVPVEFFTIR